MASTESIYSGAGYGFDSAYNTAEDYGESFLNVDYRFPAGEFGFPSDPRSANQLQAVSNKISTGAKTIEVSGVSLGQGGPMSLIDAIPKQQFEEINRLKKLAGVDLTFHGPLVEPTGVTRQGWQETDRQNAERQMMSAVRRGHNLDPKGNLVVTFHSSNGLPDPETKVINEDGEEELKEFFVVDENTGNFQNVSKQLNYLKKETKLKPNELIQKQNADLWFRELQHINFNVSQGSNILKSALSPPTGGKEEDLEKIKEGKLLEFYGDQDKLQKEMKKIPHLAPLVNRKMTEITHGDIYLRESYGEFQNLFNRAYKAAKMNNQEEDLKKLNALRDRLSPRINEIEKDPSRVPVLADELLNGVNVLRSISPPQTLKALRPWAIDKSSTTFANVALDAYKKYKDTAPIISVENPPAGSGLSRAEDLREVIKNARKKFTIEAQEKLHLSKSEAEKQANKLIGVTWDVGHINMLRGQGYEEKDIVEETKKIAPYVKHVHLSDNFGLEHTELPMGMGNVPTKKHLELINQYNKKAKKIVETGNWFEPFKTTPMKETLKAFGSPVFDMDQGPYWNQIADASGGYFSGQGAINPQVHHSIYGSGFSGLPVELGGQMAGQSRVSGAPIE